MNMVKLGYGYVGHILLWTFVLRALLVPVTPAWFMQSPTEKMVWLALLLIPAIIISWFSLGMFSQLSALFAVLLWIAHYHFVQAAPTTVQPQWLLFAAVVLAGLLYASALGFLAADFYAWGFYPRVLAVVVAVIALVLWTVAPAVSWGLALALLCFAFSIGPSKNLWDYLFDPILFFTALFFAVQSFWRH